MLKRLLSVILCAFVISAFVPATLAANERLLYSFPFENESEQDSCFTKGDSVDYEWVNSPGIGHGDDSAIKMTHIKDTVYTSSANFLQLTLPEPLPVGGIYRIVAWVHAPSAENQGKDTLTGPGFVINGNYWGEQGESKFPVNFGTLPLDEWKSIDFTLPMQEKPIETLDFRIVVNEELNHPDVWYWDNIEIYQVGDLQDVEIVELPTETEEGYPIYYTSNGGVYDDFNFELWRLQSSDTVNMILTGGGTYKCEWDALNVLFRTGKKLGSTKTYEDYGNITMEYGADYNITKGDLSFLCVYGWTEKPMIEYYILENYGNSRPSGPEGYKGSYELDDGTYELYTNTRVNQPSLQGTKTFEQYFAVRTSRRNEGTISISEHFKKWEELGLDMTGVMYEVSLCVEGYNSAGNADIYNHVLTIGDTVYGAAQTGVRKPTVKEPTVTEPAVTPNTAAPEETTVPAETVAPISDTEDSPDFPTALVIIVAVAIAALIVIIVVVVKRKSAKS